MTVLQQKQVSTGQLGQLGQIVGSMLLVGVVAAATIFAISRVDPIPTASATYEQAMQARGQAADVYFGAQSSEALDPSSRNRGFPSPPPHTISNTEVFTAE